MTHLIDALNTNFNKGLSVQLGDFGCFRPGMNCKSQDAAKDVDADTVQRIKIVFTPGYKFKKMLNKGSIYKTEGNGGNDSSGNAGSNEPENPDGSGEAPDPAA